MVKKMSKILITIMFLLLICPFGIQTALGADNDNFRFIHMTDTHVGAGKGNKYTPLVVQDILENFSNAKFILHGGDLTEVGTPREYEHYLKLVEPLDMPIYTTPGNHESRWSDASKSIYENYFGKLYYSWDHQGVHFVSLDSTIAKGQHGHLEKQMLDWLKADLGKLKKNTPIIIVTHHPVFFDESLDASKFMDNDWDLWQILKDYNVAAIFTGHGHKDLLWWMNDIPVLMTNAVMEDNGGYSVIEVNNTNKELNVYGKYTQSPGLRFLVKLPLEKEEKQPNIKIKSPTQFQVYQDKMLLRVQFANWTTQPQKVEYKLEDFSWKPLDQFELFYQKEIDLTEIDDGIRSFWVRAVDKKGKVYLDKVDIRINQKDAAEILWEFPAASGVQHAPAVSEKYLYFGDNSGKVYQLEQKTGRKIWEFTTEGAIIGSPTLHNGILYVGSADGKVYALNAVNGSKIWDYQTKEGIIAQPIVAEDKVFIGSTDFNMYALDAKTGKELWKFATENTIMQSAAYGDGTVYFGSWDQNLYALDAKTGEEKWRQELGSQIYYAPAASAPLYYQGKVFISTPGSRVYAFDGQTGAEVWEVTAASGLSSPVIFNQAIVYSTTSGAIYALDPEAGKNVWQKDTRISTYISSPIVQGGDLLLTGIKGKVVSVNTEDDTQNWTFQLGDTYLFGNGSANNDLVFIGTLEGKVFALQVEPNSTPNRPFPLMAAFSDILEHWARADLNKISQAGLINGYKDGTYRPDKPVSRAEMAVFLSRYLKYEIPIENSSGIFTDLNKHWAVQPIMAMQEKGIVSGYVEEKKKLFKPEKDISRAEAVVMLARALNVNSASEGFVSKFSDLNKHWAKDAIFALEEKGLISGYKEGSNFLFKPENSISRAEVGVLLARMLN